MHPSITCSRHEGLGIVEKIPRSLSKGLITLSYEEVVPVLARFPPNRALARNWAALPRMSGPSFVIFEGLEAPP
jgi:hypothetical protein